MMYPNMHTPPFAYPWLPRWWVAMLVLALGASCGPGTEADEAASRLPNIVILYVDDLGYGDLSAYGATGFTTPNIDRLAANGIQFTDAHSSAATCTPSRYALLTGAYGFRRNARVLPGNAPLLISTQTPTLASMLKKAGYATGVVGKWHLGLGEGELDWNGDIKPGPLEIGFDYAFLLPSTGDRVPSVYVENHRVVGLEPEDSLFISYTDNPEGGNPFGGPTGLTHPELLKQPADTQHSGSIINGISRIGFMTGGKAAEFVDEEFPDVFTDKAINFIQQHRAQPFFLYYSFHDIHVPRVPHERFAGTSGLGPRGDAILQVDWVTGEIMAQLEALGLAANTLVLFTSDNGPVLNDGYEDQAVELLGDHEPAGPFRGGKYSVYEAGTRVPTILHWPAKVSPQKSDALWSQVDLFASLATLVGVSPEPNAAPDSQDVLEALLGNSPKARNLLLEEAQTFGLRQGDWKYIQPSQGSFDWIKEKKNIEGGISTEPQLYDLARDPGEQENLADQYPERVSEMQALLDSIVNTP